MAQENQYYKHDKTGKIILVVDVFDSSNAGTNWINVQLCHVLRKGGGWCYMKSTTIDKNYTAITWQEANS